MILRIEIKEQVVQRCGLTASEITSLFEQNVVRGLVSTLQTHIVQRNSSAPCLGVVGEPTDGKLELHICKPM